MTPLLLTAVLLAAAGAATLVAGVRRRATGGLADALAEIDGPAGGTRRTLDSVEAELAEPLALRLLRPLGRRLGGVATRLLPRNHLRDLRRKLIRAGVARQISAEQFLALQAIAFVGGLVLAGLVLASPSVAGARRIAAAVLAVGIGAGAPTAWLSRHRDARVASIRRELADALDLLAISVEAGVGLEGAIEIVTRNFDSPLSHELGHTLREMELGLTRREALQNLRTRVDVPELSGFVGSLLQADGLGMPLSRVLRAQATEMRTRRRQQARETAAKLPVKLLFPLTAFIMPAIFLVVMGPAVIQMMRVF